MLAVEVMASKREDIERALAEFHSVFVAVGYCVGLVVPDAIPQVSPEVRMVLEYGLDMPRPIEDLQVDNAGIHATLSFGGLGWHKTFVPWEAVLGLRCEGQRPRAKPQLRSI